MYPTGFEIAFMILAVAKFSSLTEVLNLTRQNDVTVPEDQESLDF
jgi:hypothetical protein